MADALNQRIISYPKMISDPVFNSQGLAASNSRLGFVFRAAETDTITHLWVRHTAVTGSSPTYRVSLQTVGVTTGVPDGGLVDANGYAFFTPSGSTGGEWIALTGSVSITRGSVYAVVIDYSSGTINGSNFASFGVALTGMDSTENAAPYLTYAAAGTYAKSTNSQRLLYGYKSATTVYGNPISLEDLTTASTDGHRVASRIPALGASGITYKVRGVKLGFRTPASNGQFIVGIWDSSGTVQQSVTVDSDQLRSIGQSGSSGEFFFPGDLPALDASQVYYCGVEMDGSNTITMDHIQVVNAEDMDPFVGGSEICLSTWNGSSWTDTTTKRTYAELILSDITIPSGGSGTSSWLSLMGVGV